MNDCIWAFVFCDCKKWKCDKYVSAGDPKGEKMLKEYEAEVDAALEPIKEQFKKRYENFREGETDD